MIKKINEYISNLEDREKKFLISGSVFFIGFIIFNFVIYPFASYKKNLESGVQSNIYQIKQISSIGSEYQKIRAGSIQRITDKNFTLFSFMDSLAGKTGLKTKVDYMKPSSEKSMNMTIEKVELKLSGIDMKALVSFLYQLEFSEHNIEISGLSIRLEDKDSTLTATIQTRIYKNL